LSRCEHVSSFVYLSYTFDGFLEVFVLGLAKQMIAADVYLVAETIPVSLVLESGHFIYD